MQSLYLMRHATASAGSLGQTDRDRPLHPDGVREAARLGAHVAARPLGGALPSHVLCSTAQRALDTLEQLLPHLRQAAGSELQISHESSLYNAGREELLAQIEGVDAAGAGILVIAHNPGIATLATSLCGSGAEPLRAAMSRGFPPAALAVLDFADGVTSGVSGELVAFVTPRALAQTSDRS